MIGEIKLTQREIKDADKIIEAMLKQKPGSKRDRLIAIQYTGRIPNYSTTQDIGRITQARNLRIEMVV